MSIEGSDGVTESDVGWERVPNRRCKQKDDKLIQRHKSPTNQSRFLAATTRAAIGMHITQNSSVFNFQSYF